MFVLTLTWASISSYPLPRHTYHREGFSYISQLDGEGLACLPKPHFNASLNSWPSMIVFKAVKPQHPFLSFIIYVCGLRKKLMQGKSCHRGIQIAWVWHWSYWPCMGMLFSLIYFHLLFLWLFIFLLLFYCALFSLCAFLASYCSFTRLILAVCLSVSLWLFLAL